MKGQRVQKVDLRSHDVAADKRGELLRIFPEIRTEGGKIDFERLKQVLGESVETGRERYDLNWPGKADCIKAIQIPSLATLRPCPEESVNFDNTENLIIEGDNLEVLRLLQKSYAAKVKMIYIDPPYNTGSDFIYPANYAESLKTYLQYTGQVDTEGNRFGTNTDTDGRFHSKWLNMMYPRLYLASNLLHQDGVIFISVDDNEAYNLRTLCNEIFGEENFIAQLIWEKGRKNDAKLFSVGHEYILLFAKSLIGLKEKKTVWREQKPGAQEIWDEYLNLRQKHGSDDRKIEADLQAWFQNLPKKHPAKKLSRYKRVDRNGPWRDRDISWPGGDGPRYEVPHPVTGIPCKVPERGWGFATSEEMQRQIRLGLVEFRDDHTEPPFRKTHIKPVFEELASGADNNGEIEENDDEEMATQVRGTYFYKQSQVAVKHLRKLMGAKLFDNPKDHAELLRLIQYVTTDQEDVVVMDFFAGTGTIAEAVLQLNRKDGGRRKFILVQLPEPCNTKEKSGKAALDAQLPTISDITKERVRRVIKKLNDEDAVELDLDGKKEQDRGFSVFKLAESNFTPWNAQGAQDAEALAEQLKLHINHILDARSADDILYEILLKSGFPLTAPIEALTLAGKTVYSVAAGALFVCLERELTLELFRAMANKKPERVVCLDNGFVGNDQLKANAVQSFKNKGVTNFKTV